MSDQKYKLSDQYYHDLTQMSGQCYVLIISTECLHGAKPTHVSTHKHALEYVLTQDMYLYMSKHTHTHVHIVRTCGNGVKRLKFHLEVPSSTARLV